MKPRKLFRIVHLWASLAGGGVLSVIGLSGSALVYREEIEAWTERGTLHVEATGAPAISPGRAVAAAESAFPSALPTRVRAPRGPGETWRVRLAGEPAREVWVHPETGVVLGAADPDRMPMGWIFQLHSHLLGGETGERIAGGLAFVLVGLIATGVVLWWPGRTKLRQGFTVKRGASAKRRIYDLHRAGGIYSGTLLVAIALTGASLVFHDPARDALNRLTASPPTPKPPVVAAPAAGERLPLDRLVAAAERALPGGRLAYLTLPAAPDAPLVVRKRFPDERHPNGRNFVYLDPFSGAVLAVERAAGAPVGTRVYNALYPTHIGRWGGDLTRPLHAAAGLLPLLFMVSGLLMWRNRTGAAAPKGVARPRPATPQTRAA